MSGINDACGDDRFELIAKARARLLDATNIESRPEEVAVLDNILFRCWQMGWLDQLRDDDTRWYRLFGAPEQAARTMAGKCCDCCECVIANACEYGDGEGCLLSDEDDYDMLLEWLRGDAE